MTPAKSLLTLQAEARCPLCGVRARLVKTVLGWMCAACVKRWGAGGVSDFLFQEKLWNA